MSNFWHFGDSYSMNDFSLETPQNEYKAETQVNNFGHIISQKLGIGYKFRGVTGFSNELIFRRILWNLNYFQKNDIIFINWSYFTRGTYVDNKGTLRSTNNWFDENMPGMTDEGLDELSKIENYSFIMDYILSYNYDFNTKLFFGYVAPLFHTLTTKGIKIYNLFINHKEKLTYGNELKSFKMPIKMGENVIFEESYIEWLKKNKLHEEEEGHYTSGNQEFIANEIIKRINKNSNLI